MLSSTAHAFDGKRKGFIFQLGIGSGFQRSTQEFSGFGDRRKIDSDSGAFASDFKIGYGLSDQLLLTYTANASWANGRSVLSGRDVALAHSTGGMGLTYFLTAETPALFVDFTVGRALWAWLDDPDHDAIAGFGLAAGVGYEFRKNWAVALDLSWGNPSDNDGRYFGHRANVETSASTVGVTVSHLWY